MPLFFQQQVNVHTWLAIWKIDEGEPFFSAHVPLQRSITHPHKRLQHLAGRYLLKHLYPDFPLNLIQIADTRKPYLPDELFHFSISHCGDFAAALVSRSNRVGVDIELVSDKIQKVQRKFLSEEELGIVNGPWLIGNGENNAYTKLPTMYFSLLPLDARLTLAWSCKEAAFKWHGAGEVDFKKHLQVQRVLTTDNKLFQTSISFKKEEDRVLGLQSCFFDALCLSYVVT